jgi:hypothetical protein
MKYSLAGLSRPLALWVEVLQHGRLADVVAALWYVGAGIAGTTTFLAGTRLGSAAAVPYALVTIALLVLAAATRGRHRWAISASLLLLSVQLAGVIGSAIELVQADGSAKAGTLRALGIDPTIGILLNLTYSGIASALFVSAVVNRPSMAPSRSHASSSGALPPQHPAPDASSSSQ